MERGISMPTASRAACTYSESFSMPLSVTSLAMKGAGSARRSHAVSSTGPVTVPGIFCTRLMPTSILSQVMPISSLRAFRRWAKTLGSGDSSVSA